MMFVLTATVSIVNTSDARYHKSQILPGRNQATLVRTQSVYTGLDTHTTMIDLQQAAVLAIETLAIGVFSWVAWFFTIGICITSLRLIDNEKIVENDASARKMVYWVANSVGWSFAIFGLAGLILADDRARVLWRLAAAIAVLVLITALLMLIATSPWFNTDRRDLDLEDPGSEVNEETRLLATEVVG